MKYPEPEWFSTVMLFGKLSRGLKIYTSGDRISFYGVYGRVSESEKGFLLSEISDEIRMLKRGLVQ